MLKDIIKFFKLMGFIEIADEYDLSSGPSQTIDEYNLAVIETEKLAQKYNLYDEDQACNDPWYHLHTLWPKMKELFLEKLYEPTKKGDDTMKVNEEIELSGILEMDLEEIREHFKNNTDDWIFDHDLSQWIYMPTNQTVRGYILSNIETILSPNLLKEDVEKILWFENFEEILDELSDIELLTTLTTQEPTDKGHKIYLFGSRVYITPKQWRQIIYEATRRFIRRDE